MAPRDLSRSRSAPLATAAVVTVAAALCSVAGPLAVAGARVETALADSVHAEASASETAAARSMFPVRRVLLSAAPLAPQKRLELAAGHVSDAVLSPPDVAEQAPGLGAEASFVEPTYAELELNIDDGWLDQEDFKLDSRAFAELSDSFEYGDYHMGKDRPPKTRGELVLPSLGLEDKSLKSIDLAGNIRIYIPRAWAERIVPGSVRSLAYNEYALRLQGSHQSWVHLRHLFNEAGVRESIAARSLAPFGVANVLDAADTQTKTTFLLKETVDCTLEQFLRAKIPADWARRPHDEGKVVIPLKESLPILVDILRAAVAMQSCDIVHDELTERNLVMKDGRVLVDGLWNAHLSDPYRPAHTSSDPNYPFVSAPESLDRAAGCASHVWAAGILFAKMCTGVYPTESYARDRYPELVKQMESDPSRAHEVRAILKNAFGVSYDPAVSNLKDPNIQKLLRAMLMVNPQNRWSALKALTFARKIAQKYNIEVPEFARQRPELPSGWVHEGE